MDPTVEPFMPDARGLLSEADVWDVTLPWPRTYQDMDVLRRFHRAGFTFVSLTLQDLPATFQGTVNAIADWRRVAGENADWMTMADSLDDIAAARRAGKLAMGINVQDSMPIGGMLDRVETFRRLGVWHMLLAYQTRSLAADGCAEPGDAGLSLFGRALVERMNAAGIVVDCAHTGYRSSLEAMELTTLPAVFSHCGAFEICKHIRNIRDDQIKACAATGGLVGVVGIGAFLGDPQARTETVFRHLDHVVSLVGPEHAAIGTDFVLDMEMIWRWMGRSKEGAWRDPFGTQLYEGGSFQPEQLVELVAHMLSAGYDRDAIAGILGGNMRRVYAASHRAGQGSAKP